MYTFLLVTTRRIVFFCCADLALRLSPDNDDTERSPPVSNYFSPPRFRQVVQGSPPVLKAKSGDSCLGVLLRLWRLSLFASLFFVLWRNVNLAGFGGRRIWWVMFLVCFTICRLHHGTKMMYIRLFRTTQSSRSGVMPVSGPCIDSEPQIDSPGYGAAIVAVIVTWWTSSLVTRRKAQGVGHKKYSRLFKDRA